MSPSRTRISPSFSAVAAAVAVRNSLKLKNLKYFPDPDRSRRSRWHTCKNDMPADGVEQMWADARDAVEPFQAPERPVLGTPIRDALRQRRPHARQTRDLRHVGAVEIDPLAGSEGTSELRGAARRLAQVGPAGRGGRLELNVAGRRIGRGRKEKTHAGTGEGQRGEKESGAAIVHPPTCKGTARNRHPKNAAMQRLDA